MLDRFTPGALTRLCPSHVGGDREFAGHGPRVFVTAAARVAGGSRQIWADLYLHAKETRPDWTEAEGRWSFKIYDCPNGARIKRIVSDTSSEAYYVDTDHSLDRPVVQGGQLVRTFEVMGDTGGNDVGNCTPDDMYLNVHFNEIVVELDD